MPKYRRCSSLAEAKAECPFSLAVKRRFEKPKIGGSNPPTDTLVNKNNNMSKRLIIAPVEYVQGHLRSGEFRLTLDAETFEMFSNLTEDGQKEYIRDNGHLKVTDESIEDYGPITKISVANV